MGRGQKYEKDTYVAYSEFMNDSEWIVGLDPGHGSIINGICETPEKTYKHDWGIFCEGMFNRAIAIRVSGKLIESGISHYFTTDSNLDISLPIRTTRANNFKRRFPKKKHLFISIHGNAFSDESANGFEVWTSPEQTLSDEYATVMYDEFKGLEWKMRSDFTDGDPDKESRFWVLIKTSMPAILLELGFYSNPEEAKKMLDPKVQDQMAQFIVNGILKIITSDDETLKELLKKKDDGDSIRI